MVSIGFVYFCSVIKNNYELQNDGTMKNILSKRTFIVLPLFLFSLHPLWGQKSNFKNDICIPGKLYLDRKLCLKYRIWFKRRKILIIVSVKLMKKKRKSSVWLQMDTAIRKLLRKCTWEKGQWEIIWAQFWINCSSVTVHK